MTEELKPCPFCGGTNLRDGGNDHVCGIECLDCECAGPNQYLSGRDWNVRPEPHVLAERYVAVDKSGHVGIYVFEDQKRAEQDRDQWYPGGKVVRVKLVEVT